MTTIATAHQMLDAHPASADPTIRHAEMVIVKLFKDEWMSALSKPQIIKMARARGIYVDPEAHIGRALARMVRSKTLRRNGKLYEINY